MNLRSFLPLLLATTSIAFADPHPGDQGSGAARNKDGSIVTGVLTAQFDPANGNLPFPNNLLFVGSSPVDLTLDIPVADPTNKSDPSVVLNALDGFSPTERWIANFLDDDGNPGNIDPASVVPGQSVRVFQVTTQQFVAVTGIVRELTPGVEYTAVSAPGGVLAIVPLVPLAEYSSFMAVLTNDIRDTAGNNATPDQTYFLTQRDEPWLDANGQSTYALVDDATAAGLAALQPLTWSMEAAAGAAGIDHDDIILAWTVQTQAVSPTLRLLRSITQPAPVQALPTGMTTAAVGGFGLADIVVGVITLPYYLGIPTDENPAAPLTDNWEAEPGAYIPPFDQFGLDPNSTNVTVANPFPSLTGMVTVPVIMTVPNANSGNSKPDSGWPVTIYSHGITRNRIDMLALADSMAAAGQVLIAMDHPMHGVVPEVEPDRAPFKIDNHPVFGAIASERHFEVDFFDNATQQPIPDGIPDRSGQSYFNLANLLAARDNLRQSIADLFVLTTSLQGFSVDGDATPDLDSTNVSFAANSYGVFIGVPYLAIEPMVSRAYLNAGGALLLRTGEAGDFGPLIRALLGGAGIEPGSTRYEQFLTVGQTAIGFADPASYAMEAAMKMPILHNTVINDLTVPNTVAGQPLGGNEGLTRLMSLNSFSSTQMDPEGLRAVARFVPPAFHESLFTTVNRNDPEITAPEATAEMQGQMASFIASGGTFINVGNPDTLVPVASELSDLLAPVVTPGERGGKTKRGSGSGDDRSMLLRLKAHLGSAAGGEDND